MRIRTLNQDFDGNQLEIFRGGDGDVYVTIYQNESSSDARREHQGMPVTVRVGMSGSGMHLPGRMGELFNNLATEFENYKEFKFESDAVNSERAKRFEELKLKELTAGLLPPIDPDRLI